jgi:hypothetical protein
MAHHPFGQPPSVFREEPIMVTLVFIAAASVAGIVGTIVLAARDGYRRQPQQTFARTF